MLNTLVPTSLTYIPIPLPHLNSTTLHRPCTALLPQYYKHIRLTFPRHRYLGRDLWGCITLHSEWDTPDMLSCFFAIELEIGKGIRNTTDLAGRSLYDVPKRTE